MGRFKDAPASRFVYATANLDHSSDLGLTAKSAASR